MRKKSIITLIVMLTMLFAFGALNASAETYGDLTYEVSQDGTYITITDCDSSVTTVEIPNYISGKPVTTIGESAFFGCDITSITIPNSVTTIEQEAFYLCSDLTNIVIPDSVVTIGRGAFQSCKNLSTVTLGENVANIYEFAFFSCSNLTSITVSNSNKYFSSIGAVIFNKEKSKIVSYNGNKTETSYTIPNTVTQIGDYAFSGCTNLTSVAIPDGVTTIGEWSFYACTKLSTINIPSSVITIGNNAFDYCGLTGNVIIPNGVKTIGESAFDLCSGITSISVPSSVISIGDDAFNNCKKLTEINVDTNNEYYSSVDGVLFNKNKTELISYPIGKTDENYIIPDGTTTIESHAFYNVNLVSMLIPSTITHFDTQAVYGCKKLSKVIYNGDEIAWGKMRISPYNTDLTNATREYFWRVVLHLEDKIVEQRYEPNSLISFSAIPEKLNYNTHLYKDINSLNEFKKTTPITSNLELYVVYRNRYTYKFVNDNGEVLKEETINLGATIIPPDTPTKMSTAQYTYIFARWSGYTEGMTIENDITFTATYSKTTNQYTYSFVDDNGSVLKKVTVDYGTSITPPAIPTDREPYEFEYWDSYTAGMKITKDITFTAVYKYKNYVITAEGVSEPITATYNSNFVINPQYKDGYNFIGYFTEKNGNGNQITNENGESLSPYNVVGNMNVYPYFCSQYVNRIELQGTTSATLGDAITQKAIFATDKSAMYLTATIKYPKHLEFRDIKGVDFIEASEEPEKTVDDFKYLDITCLYNYQGENIPVNTNLVPFEIEFVVAADAKIGNTEIAIENVLLFGATNYNIVDITNHTLEIKAKLAESIEIIGEDSVDKPTQFNTIISPDYATNKSVVWSVDDETIATVSQNGVVTPIKNGSIMLTATTADGSGLSAKKTIEISAYAKIDSLDFGNGIVLKEFNADVREYIVYVREDATSITLTPTFSGGGVLRANGSGIWVSNSPKIFEITEEEPAIITLNRENVTDMTNSVYTIKVVKFEGTKSEIFNNDKTFKIVPINIETGKLVILALYDNKQLVDIQKTTNTGEEITFTTSKTYTNAKVMVWDDFTTLRPVCNAEIVK